LTIGPENEVVRKRKRRPAEGQDDHAHKGETMKTTSVPKQVLAILAHAQQREMEDPTKQHFSDRLTGAIITASESDHPRQCFAEQMKYCREWLQTLPLKDNP
jgi:hypothetical protein